ncbi:MAG TPA: PEP-CTERM sorting domain-containing protein [Vicinamibacterales bacterium]|nr:PEP-CTERM sorting domain-containing protein [Vicinamibacterales bacterium]
MRVWKVALACSGALLLVTAAARADPITVNMHTSAGVAPSSGSTFVTHTYLLNLGSFDVSAGGSGTVFIDGLTAHRNYVVSFAVNDPTANPWTTLSAEVLDPLSDGFDEMDPSPQPDYVPAGFTTSNNTDGLSFAWNSGLTRSATFAGGGSATVFADENSNSRDMLQFLGFDSGVSRVYFALRDNLGNRGFLLRLSANGVPDPVATPEPASMLLLATGLLGLFAFRRRQAC